jgi:hypothetical protein
MALDRQERVVRTRSGGTGSRWTISWRGSQGSSSTACPPAGLVVAGRSVGRVGVPDLLAGQVPAVGHPGAEFLGDLADERVTSGLARFELAARQVPEPGRSPRRRPPAATGAVQARSES